MSGINLHCDRNVARQRKLFSWIGNRLSWFLPDTRGCLSLYESHIYSLHSIRIHLRYDLHDESVPGCWWWEFIGGGGCPKSQSAMCSGEEGEEEHERRMDEERNRDRDSRLRERKIKGTSSSHILYPAWLIKVCKDVFRNADLSWGFCLRVRCFLESFTIISNDIAHKVTVWECVEYHAFFSLQNYNQHFIENLIKYYLIKRN